MALKFITTTILAFVTCIPVAPRKQVCPLQCYCNRNQYNSFDVTCSHSNFSSVPVFPDTTVSIRLIEKAKLTLIQGNSFSNLMNLKKLHLRSVVPWRVSGRAFDKLSNLKFLYLKTTHSNPLPEDVFADLTSLSALYLSIKIARIPHRAICNVQKLHILGLSDNELKNITFDHCFSLLSSLSTLRLSGNPIQSLDGHEFEAFRSIKLALLVLDTCHLTKLGPETFQYLKHLKTLSLVKNKLTVLPKGIFRHLKLLTQLSLTENLLTTMPCAALEPLTTIVELNLNYNKMTNITICPEFRNFTALRALYMLNDRISSMDDRFFESLQECNLKDLYLTVLRMSPLALKALKGVERLSLKGKIQNSTYLHFVMQGLGGSNIRAIDAADLGLARIIGEDMFRSLAKTNLSILKMYHCQIQGVSEHTFSPLSKLELLDLSNNRITDFPLGTFRNLIALKHLVLVKNSIISFALDRWCMQDNIRELNLAKNNIRRLGQYSFKGLTRLENINLGNNYLEGLSNNIFTGTNINLIKLSMNNLKSLPNELLRMTKHLEILHIELNKITLTNRLNPSSPFAELQNVTEIELANFIIEWNYQHFGNFFNGLTKLKSLKLTDWRLQILPVSLFLGTHNLDILVLSKNEIASWDPKLFQPLYELTRLELNRNKIVSISKEGFYYLPNLRRLDLSDNALACNCELMWFREWIETAFIYIPNVQNKHNYHCEAPERFKGVAFLDFSLSETDCIVFSLVKLSVTFSSVIVLLLVAAGLVYRFRFEVQMFMFYVRSRQQRLLDGIDTLEYVYDAYVIYSSGDRRWVLDKLMAYLESSRGYRLCIEDRDWLGGRAIVDNIIESIESSRRVILVLSIEFVRNSWCVETAEMAQSHLLNRNKNTLIPILLADIPPENLPPSIRSVFATRTLLPWPKGDTNKRKQDRKEDKFWKTLNTALKKIVRQNVSGRLDQGVGADNEISSGDDI